MMNRYHNKQHRANHHTTPNDSDPDAGHDPIASPDSPFQGDFNLAGGLIFKGAGSGGTIRADGEIAVLSDMNIQAAKLIGLNLNYCEDVDIVTPVDGYSFTYNAARSAWVASKPSLPNLKDVGDVANDLGGVDGQALICKKNPDNTVTWTNGYPNAVYADLAENYIARSHLRVGHIVSMSSSAVDLDLCTRSSFDKLLGVVTDKPGMLLDAELENGTPVSYIGKVDILVHGTCKRGDIIVLSKIDGVGKVAGKFDKKYKLGYARCDKMCSDIGPVECVLKTL